ncbi:MAG: aconitate hydratase [Bacteroidales bacterium]|nr:aconitate hydratase [Bacteroidales bacterium]
MVLDFEIIKSFYERLPDRISKIKKVINKPLTLSEKILYTHLFQGNSILPYKRGEDYVEFAPDRIAMQDATAQMALLQFINAGKANSAVPVSIHCDHLVMAKEGAESDLKSALIGNKEVYDFLSSICDKYDFDFWKPGSGIIHQVVLENYAFPGGMMIGTDSHTVNSGGLGMIGIGVGGADAVDVMSGMGWELKFPKLIGIILTGQLKGWTSPKDIILKLAGMLTVSGGTGYIIEYFGEGAKSISCTGKATICNMGAEVGATCSVFGFDKSMSDYLVATGRKNVAHLAEKISEHLTGDMEVYVSPEKYFDKVLEINLSELEPYINGPFTPDFATPISGMKETAKKNGWPVKIETGLIGSCTNSSYEDISKAASVAEDALSKNLTPEGEFAVTPGSEEIRSIAERDGFLSTFKKIGGKIFANACGPCIGQWERKCSDKNHVNTIIHSFNRNFAKRNDGNPNTHAFVASPEIVTALTIAGDLTFNPLIDYLTNSKGEKVKFNEPSGFVLPPQGFLNKKEGLQKNSKNKTNISIIINPSSDRLQFLSPFPEWDGKDFTGLHLLIKTKGKCTTDHISMAGPWLKYRGHLENISNNYMIGAINFFTGQPSLVLNQITGNYESVPNVAKFYRSSGKASIVVGEENFGEGSSREHAAMEPRYLNVKAILAKSFARIHETNLKKQGVLALTFSDKNDYDKILEKDRIDIVGLNKFSPGTHINLILHHDDGSLDEIYVNHSYNETQIEWFKAGSALNLIKNKNEKYYNSL